MEADVLRLILFVAGLALVLGIYFWDRRKRAKEHIEPVRREPTAGDVDDDLALSVSEGAEWNPDDSMDVEQELQQLDEILNEERETAGEQGAGAARPSPSPGAGEPSRQKDLFGFRTSEAPKPPPPRADLPVKILQINVVARGAYFEGNDILRAANETGLEPGDMRIFHRLVGTGKSARPLFSMASLVEPGAFPLDAMAEFSTPGLILFAQLPGPRDGLAVFSDMLFTAERLGAVLDGELQDETRSALTKQTIEHVREEILEHRRKIQLLQMKQ